MSNTITLVASGNGGINNDVTVFDGSLVVVADGAIAKNLFVNSIVNSQTTGAIVETGGTVETATVNGAMTIDGSVSNLLFNNLGGWVTVGAGGSLQGATFVAGTAGDSLYALSGAYVDAVTINGADLQLTALAKATVNGSVIEKTNIQVMSAGSSENGTDIKTGGVDDSGGNASAVTIEGGGTESVSGTATGGLVESKGIVDVASTGLLNSYTIAGTANVAAGGDIENPVLEGGTLNLTGTLIGTVTFKGTGSTLNLIGQTGTVAIAGFTAGNTIMVEGITDPSTVTLSDTETSFTIGGIALQFSNGEGMGFTLTTVGTATEITLLNAGINCFVAGTQILTAAGERSVESLKIGDEIITASGEAKTVKWMGYRSYGNDFPIREAEKPIRIKKGALAKGVPAKDLLVSPGHSLQIGDVLVPAELLVNGQSIVIEKTVKSVTYHHIELADHDIIIANGAPAETFIDQVEGQEFGLRGQFHNGHTYKTLYPDDKGATELCLPRVTDGFALQAIQHTINARAGIAPTEALGEGKMIGYVEKTGQDGIISGWVYREGQPDVPVRVDVIIDGNIRTILANGTRKDVRKAGLASDKCGFKTTLPEGIRPDAVIEVRSTLDQTAIPLTEDAARVYAGCSALEPVIAKHVGKLQGYVEEAGETGEVAGWAVDSRDPDAPIGLDIYAAGQYITSTQTTTARGDLQMAGINNGKQGGFRVRLPTGVEGEIEVCRTADQKALAHENHPAVQVASLRIIARRAATQAKPIAA